MRVPRSILTNVAYKNVVYKDESQYTHTHTHGRDTHASYTRPKYMLPYLKTSQPYNTLN